MAARTSPLATRWMILGEWRAHPARVALAALAIAIGVALGFAVHLINASALNEFAQAVRTVNGDADLQVRAAGPTGFDEGLYPTVARAPGVAAASPVVELPATFDGAVGATLLGVDVIRAAQATPSLLGLASGGLSSGQAAVFDSRAVFLSQAALAQVGKPVGAWVDIAAGGHMARFRIAGVLPAVAEGQSVAVVDIAAAQWRFGRLGRLDRLDLRAARGADLDRVRAALAARLPADAVLGDQASAGRQSDSLSRAYRVNLDMLALIALLTGAFLVYSAQSLSVARRGPQFALLRVLGVRRQGLLIQVVLEGLVVGGLGAAAGLLLGLGLAEAALRFLGGDLGGGYFSGERPALVFAPRAAAVFFALGLVAALAGSLFPARTAARAQPAIALKNAGDAVDPRTSPGAIPALVLLAAGGACALLPAVRGLPVFGYLSIALLLAGGVAAMPWLARALLSPLQRLAGLAPSADLALKRLWGAPSQAAIALCGIVASTSLMIAMAVMVASFRGSVDDWLGQVLADDLYLRIEGDARAGFDPDQQVRLAQTPGVARVLFLRTTPLRLSTDQPPVALIARDVAAALRDEGLPILGRTRTPPAGITPVWLSEPAARLYGRQAGETFTLPLGGGTTVFVAGVWRDYSRQHGAIVLDAADYDRLTGDLSRSEAAVTLAPGARAGTVIAALKARLSPALAARTAFAEPRQLRALALRLFDRSFAVTYLLEAIAIVVGLAGVAATISAQTLARTKEFGMLRHLGVLRRQIVAMLAAEGALLGAIGGAAGIGLGLAISQVLIHVVNPQSFHWTMETRLPLALFASVAATLVIASAGAALLAGRRALSDDAVRAVREDW